MFIKICSFYLSFKLCDIFSKLINLNRDMYKKINVSIHITDILQIYILTF